MALSTPTIKEIETAILAQIQAVISVTIPLFPKAFTRVMSKVLAGVFMLCYKYAGFIFLQIFVSRATLDMTVINGLQVSPLTEWGRLFGEGDPIPAVSARVEVRLKFSSSLGTTLPAGSKFLKVDTGVTYATLSDVVITPDFLTDVEAIQTQAGNGGAGALGNCIISDTMDYVVVPVGALSGWSPTVTALVQTGTDAELADVYRARVINKMQRRPQGGAYADYFEWGTDAAGVVNIYPYTGSPGEVDVYVEATPASSGDPDGIPTAAQLLSVAAFIELDTAGLAYRRPVSSFVTVYPITRAAVDVTIENLIGIPAGEIAAAKVLIDAAITEKMLTYEPYIAGLTVDARNTCTRAEIAGAAFQVAWSLGGTIDNVLIARSGSPISESVSVGVGEKFKAGTIVYS